MISVNGIKPVYQVINFNFSKEENSGISKIKRNIFDISNRVNSMKHISFFSISVVFVLLFLSVIVPVIAEDSDFVYALKPSPVSGPYNDQKFMDLATSILTNLSGKVIPIEGVELLNLKSNQIQLSRMNISPEFYPQATKINSYLLKICQAGETYSTTKTLTDHPNTLGSPVYDQYTKARSNYSDAMALWADIKDLFPKIKQPILPDPKLPVKSSHETEVPSDTVF